MNLIPGFGWLKAVTTRRIAANPSPDPGDMGTAFGLDASIGPSDELPTMAAGELPAQSLLPWERRLTRRSSL